MTTPLLEVRHLRVEFPTRRGTLVALDDVSFDIAPGEILGVVGESGAGKSLTGASIIGLLDPPGRVAGGEIRFGGQRIDNLPYEAMRKIRGRHIGAIFQDPLTSLNPLYTVGRQLVETIQAHLPVSDALRDVLPVRFTLACEPNDTPDQVRASQASSSIGQTAIASGPATSSTDSSAVSAILVTISAMNATSSRM